MSTSINIGRYGSLELNGSADHVLQAASAHRESPVDAAQAIEQSLAVPLAFPALAEALVPGDRVAVAVGDGIPQVADVVHGALRTLEQAGVERDSIDVVLADAADEQSLAGKLGAARLAVHNPGDASQLCFMGLTSAGRELRINRHLFEADIVLPLTCARHSEEHDARGVFQGLFPRFADEETIRRFRQLESWTSSARKRELAKETAEAGWLVGAPLVVEVVPDRGDRVAAVLAGDPTAVAAEAQRQCAEVWSSQFPESASLVVAVVAGDQREQTWDNIARALAAAGKVAGDGGAVAVVCDVRGRLGKSLGRLVRSDDREALGHKLMNDTSDDNWCAWELIQALERGPVYLMSGLDAETVEELGVAPIANKNELARLMSRHPTCIVLEGAQHVVPTVA
ncbi:MAG: lactate racemase domain-containing protein [Pirellulales bacterium]